MGEESHVTDRTGLVGNPKGRNPYESLRVIVRTELPCISRQLLGSFWPGSLVSIATEYGLDGPGSNPGGGRHFLPVQTCPGAHPSSCKMGTGSFPGVKCGRGVLLTNHPLPVPRSWKSRAIPLPIIWATPGL